MLYTYEIISSPLGGDVVKRIDSDGNEAWIPTDAANSDYQAYLATLDKA